MATARGTRSRSGAKTSSRTSRSAEDADKPKGGAPEDDQPSRARGDGDESPKGAKRAASKRAPGSERAGELMFAVNVDVRRDRKPSADNAASFEIVRIPAGTYLDDAGKIKGPLGATVGEVSEEEMDLILDRDPHAIKPASVEEAVKMQATVDQREEERTQRKASVTERIERIRAEAKRAEADENARRGTSKETLAGT